MRACVHACVCILCAHKRIQVCACTHTHAFRSGNDDNDHDNGGGGGGGGGGGDNDGDDDNDDDDDDDDDDDNNRMLCSACADMRFSSSLSSCMSVLKGVPRQASRSVGLLDDLLGSFACQY